MGLVYLVRFTLLKRGGFVDAVNEVLCAVQVFIGICLGRAPQGFLVSRSVKFLGLGVLSLLFH